MALPPVVVRISADISELLAKVEAAKAAMDDFNAKVAESQAATKGESEFGGGGPGKGLASAGLVDQYGRPIGGAGRAPREAEQAVGAVDRPIQRAATDAGKMNQHLEDMRQNLGGGLRRGLENFASNLQNVTKWLQGFSNAAGQFGNALGTMTGSFTGPLGMLGSLVGFAKTWAVMVPTLMAAPALLAAVGGVAGGVAGSFTVLSSAVGLFAMGAMKALSYVTSVSNMAQYDALSAPLQRLYMAYHNLSNEFTIMTQTMGQNTIVSVLTDMFQTMGTVVQRLGPLMGQVASAVQSAFSVFSGSLLGPQFEHFISWIGAEATPVLTTFAQTFTNFASGWAGLMEDLTPAITLFDNGMVHLTQTFANWANSPKGRSQVEGFLSYVQKAWPEIAAFWQGLGHIFYEFFSSAAAGAPAMAANLGHLFTVIGNGIPHLVEFADKILPGIVNGFAQFTGGFFQGIMASLGPLLDKLSGKGGPNWRQIGVDAGKFLGDLIAMVPSVASLVAGMLQLSLTVTKLVGGVRTLVIAWMLFRGALALGQLTTGLVSILTLLSKIRMATISTTAATEGLGAAGAASGAEGAAGAAAGGGAGVTGMSTALTGGLVAAAAPFAAAVATVLGPALLVMHGSQAQRNAQLGNFANAMRSRSAGNPAFGARFGAGTTPGNVQVNAPTNITVQGNADTQTVEQIRQIVAQSQDQLVQKLIMTRGAY